MTRFQFGERYPQFGLPRALPTGRDGLTCAGT